MRHHYRNLFIVASSVVMVFLGGFSSVAASTSLGTIDNTNKQTKICQDVSCTTFGNINFLPTINSNTPGAVPMSINDSGITGNAWGDQIGWINFTPIGGGVTINPNTGVLSGKAYASVGSWINFSATGQSVTLVDNGSGSDFQGYAWVSGAYGGWMKFDCSSSATCIKTDWRSIPNRPVVTPPSGGNGGSGGGGGGTGGGTSGGGTIPTSTVIPRPTINTTPTINPSSTFPQPPSPRGDNEKSPTQSSSNTFDTNEDGVPENIPQVQINQDASTYKQVFPRYSNNYTQKPNCIFCVVMRHDVLSTNAGDKDRSIVKFGFISQKIEIRIPFSKLSNTTTSSPIPDVDGTSVAVVVVSSWVLWKFLLARALLFLR